MPPRGTLETKFLEAARNAFFVFDEVHNMYTAAIRNSTMREAALLCTKFVCMTATPIGSPSQPYALDWLKDTVGFPVSRENQLVASAMDGSGARRAAHREQRGVGGV